MKVTLTFEVGTDYKYLAKDKDGEVVLFTDKPQASEDPANPVWLMQEGSTSCSLCSLSFSPKKEVVMPLMARPWKKSLAEVLPDGSLKFLED